MTTGSTNPGRRVSASPRADSDMALPSRRAIRSAPRLIAISAMLLIIAIFSLLPVWIVVVSAFKSQLEYAENIFAPPTSLSVDNFAIAWQQARIGIFMRNSAIVSVGAVVLCITVSVCLAYAITFLEWRGRGFAFTLCLLLLAVPPLLLLIPVFHVLVLIGLVNNLLGLILLYAALGTPFAVFLLVSYMGSLPTAVVEAAVIDGASAPRLLIDIVVPLSTPAIATAASLFFLFCWNEFIYTFVVLHSDDLRTLPAGLAALQGRYFTNFPVLLAGIALSVAPVIAVYVFFQRYLTRGIAVGVE